MNENNLIKERLLTTIETDLLPIIPQKYIKDIIIVISKDIQNLTFNDDSYLPSIEVEDNNKICNTYLATKKIEGLSDKSINAYKFSIKKLLLYFDCDLKDITTNHLRVFFAEYGKTVSLVTVDNLRRNLNSFFQWLEDENYIEKNPCKKIKRIKTPYVIKTLLTTAEIERIRDTCIQSKNVKYLALIDLLLSTGIRCEEVTKIKISDCNFENKTIQIHGKGSKDRIVYMNDRCKMHLMEYLEQRNCGNIYIFSNSSGNKMTTGGLSYTMRKIGKMSNVENCQVHRFRKYFASSLAEKGCDIIYIQQLLGHSKLDTTKKHYVSINQNNAQNIFNRLAS